MAATQLNLTAVTTM